VGEPPIDSDGRATEPGRRRRTKPWKVALAALAVVAVGAAGYWVLGRPTRPAGPPLYFGAHPDFPEETIREGFAPLVGYLEGRLDRPVDVKVAPSYDAMRADLVSGKVHFANLSPLLFVRTRAAAPGIQPLAVRTQEGARTFEAYIVARDDSGIEDVSDLLGRRFCYVDRSSTSGFLFARQYMRAHGIDPDRDLAGSRFSGTHVDVLRDILAGRCDAGATYSDALLGARNLELAASKIRLVAVTGHAPLDVICASPKLPAGQAKAIKQALFDFDPQRDLGRKIVSPIFRIDGFEEVRVEDFDFLIQAARAEKLIE
jgi:phosphonate transport system substrate-binding protein